jgi:hypothetical protein
MQPAEYSLSVISDTASTPRPWNVSWNESHENCVRLVLSVHRSAASVQAERSERRSGPLLTAGSGFKSLAAHPS